MTSAARVETLHPLRHPLTTGRIAAMLALLVPTCMTALVLGLDGGDPAPAVALIGLALVGVSLLVGIVRTSRIRLVPGGISNHRLVDTAEVRADQVAKGVVRRIQSGEEVAPRQNLFLLDAAGRTLFRLSDRWWTAGQISRIVTHLALPVESSDEVIHLSELRRVAREQLRWGERYPVLAAAVKIVVVCLASFVIASLATASL